MYGVSSSEDPFKIWVRVDEGTCGVRFEAEHGRGILSLRSREDPPAVSHFEELELPIDSLKTGRFLHLLPGGHRKAYGLSSLEPERLDHLEPGRWYELEPITEHGFRRLCLPASTEAPAQTAPKPRPADPVPAGPLPPRQTPMDPALAHEALSRLSHQDALAALQREMAKVDVLQHRIDELERQLKMSQARENDLLTVLQRWRHHQ